MLSCFKSINWGTYDNRFEKHLYIKITLIVVLKLLSSEDGQCLFNSQVSKKNIMQLDIMLVFFDVSHMGEIEISGKDAEQFIQYILSNDTNLLTNDKAMYSALCNDEGHH